MRKIISIVSGKGGTGKTFVTCNTGVLLAGAGFKTLIVDADVNMASVELFYGFRPKATLQELVEGVADVKDVVYTGPGSVLVVPAGVALRRRVRPKEFDDAVAKIVAATETDFVLIDTPAGLDAQVITCVRMSDEYLIVANPEVPSLVDAFKVRKVIGNSGRLMGSVLNKVDRIQISKKHIQDSLGEIIATIPNDARVPATINEGIPFVVKHPDSIATKQLCRIASKITGVEVAVKEGKKFDFLRRLK